MEPNDDSALRNIILGRIRERGKITFAEFMAACLYEPGLGYYTSPGKKVGAEGDFYTSSNVHERLNVTRASCLPFAFAIAG